MYEEFKKIFDRFSFHETAGTEENDNKDESAQNAALSKKSDSDSEEEEQDNQQKEKGVSNKKKKLQRRMKIAELRQICLRPDVVEVHLKFTLGEEKTIVSSKITVFPIVEGKTNKDTNFSRSGLGWRDSDFGIVLVVWVLAVYNQIWAPGILGLTISRGAMMKLFDAHCHLQDPRILSKAPQLIAKAIDTGVVRFAVNGVSEKDWALVKQMGENYPSVIPCFGLHPWYVAERTPSWFNTLKECLECTPSAAVGEIGLDKGSRGKEIDFTDQIDVFRQQLELAIEFKRPASIHCVRAFGDLLQIMKYAS